MCGISGIYKFGGGEVRANDLTRMRETLVHRGPDSGGDYISPDKTAGLSQRRLAIIDLRPEAACPMANEDGSLWITFNGEIYNFKELREDLAGKGHEFRSHGDTETVLHGYEEYGPDIVKRLNGMFAVAIWDEKKRELFLARDHVGVKPLYYAVQNGSIFFGSEIKAILAHPEFRKEFEEANASFYLTFGAMPAPYTLFRDIKKLPAAHYVLVGAAGIKEEKEYWNPLGADRILPWNAKLEDYAAKTGELLRDSIRLQMVSDVPFGCLLSGGIDSSLNAALMSQALGRPVETFTIGAKETEKYNEFEYSRMMAAKLGAKTHERYVSRSEFLGFIESLGGWMDDPNADATSFLVFYLSELVRRSGVVVIQTGEGGDELFAGYETYQKALRLRGAWREFTRLPQFAKNIAAGGAELLGFPDFETEYARRLAAGEEPFWGHATAFSPIQKKRILAPNLKTSRAWFRDYEIIGKYYADIKRLAPDTDYLSRLAYLDLKTRLADFLLMRVDKMGMAHSIEARVPFLDRRIVELALQTPAAVKLAAGPKSVLKSVARGVLPEEIIERKKQGFGAPVEEWWRSDETGGVLLRKITGSRLAEKRLFDYREVERLWRKHRRGENHTFRLMTLLTLSLWYDYWFK